MLVGLYMAGSVWSCDCGFLQPFLALQRRLGSKIIDRNDLKCISSNFRNEAITAMDSVPCANDEDALVDADFHASKVSQLDYTPILVSVLLAVLMIVVGYLLAFTFRSSIKEWLYRQTKGTTAGKASSVYTNDKDKLFDVFISYPVEDRDFVEQSFAPNLEHGATSYRLCLHQRNFPPTTPVFDTVSVAVESSARALVVLSRPYLSSQWSQIRAPFISSIMANNSKVIWAASAAMPASRWCPPSTAWTTPTTASTTTTSTTRWTPAGAAAAICICNTNRQSPIISSCQTVCTSTRICK